MGARVRGPDGVRNGIAALLGEVLPVKVPLLRAAFGITQDELPDIDVVASGEIPESSLSSLGMTWVEVINPRLLPGMRRVDIDPSGYPVYRLRYACRIYCWALGLDWDSALKRRDMIAAAVRASLLEFPTLQTAPGDHPQGYLVHEDTYTEEYGAPVRAPNDSGRTWASALCSIDMWSEESMADGAMRPAIGAAETTRIGASIVGPTQPIPDDLPTPDAFVPVTTP